MVEILKDFPSVVLRITEYVRLHLHAWLLPRYIWEINEFECHKSWSGIDNLRNHHVVDITDVWQLLHPKISWFVGSPWHFLSTRVFDFSDSIFTFLNLWNLNTPSSHLCLVRCAKCAQHRYPWVTSCMHVPMFTVGLKRLPTLATTCFLSRDITLSGEKMKDVQGDIIGTLSSRLSVQVRFQDNSSPAHHNWFNQLYTLRAYSSRILPAQDRASGS